MAEAGKTHWDTKEPAATLHHARQCLLATEQIGRTTGTYKMPLGLQRSEPDLSHGILAGQDNRGF